MHLLFLANITHERRLLHGSVYIYIYILIIYCFIIYCLYLLFVLFKKKEKEILKQKVESLIIMEQEAQDFKEIKLLKEQLEKSFKLIEKENNRLQMELNVAGEITANLTKDRDMLLANSQKVVFFFFLMI